MRKALWVAVAAMWMMGCAAESASEPASGTDSPSELGVSTNALTKTQSALLTLGSKGVAEKASAPGNFAFGDTLLVTVNTSEASALLTWAQSILHKSVVEQPDVLRIQLPDGSTLISLARPELITTDLSSSKDEVILTISAEAKQGMVQVVAPKLAWDLSWPPKK